MKDCECEYVRTKEVLIALSLVFSAALRASKDPEWFCCRVKDDRETWGRGWTAGNGESIVMVLAKESAELGRGWVNEDEEVCTEIRRVSLSASSSVSIFSNWRGIPKLLIERRPVVGASDTSDACLFFFSACVISIRRRAAEEGDSSFRLRRNEGMSSSSSVGESDPESESNIIGIVPFDRLGGIFNCETLSTGLGGVTGVPRGYVCGVVGVVVVVVLEAGLGVRSSSALGVASARDFDLDGGGVTGVFINVDKLSEETVMTGFCSALSFLGEVQKVSTSAVDGDRTK